MNTAFNVSSACMLFGSGSLANITGVEGVLGCCWDAAVLLGGFCRRVVFFLCVFGGVAAAVVVGDLVFIELFLDSIFEVCFRVVLGFTWFDGVVGSNGCDGGRILSSLFLVVCWFGVVSGWRRRKEVPFLSLTHCFSSVLDVIGVGALSSVLDVIGVGALSKPIPN
jgi:hypothetical protein